MKRILPNNSRHKAVRPDMLMIATLMCAMVLWGCQSKHPDDQAAVYNALDKSNLASVTVTQDRENGVITLTGIVGSQQSSTQAQSLAATAAPGYTIKNELQVNNTNFMKDANPKSALDPGSATTMPAK